MGEGGIFELHIFFVNISLGGIIFRMQEGFSGLLAAHDFFSQFSFA